MNGKGVLWTLLVLITALLAGVSYFYYQETQNGVDLQKGLDQASEETAKHRKKIAELEEVSQKAESEKKRLSGTLATEKETLAQQLAEKDAEAAKLQQKINDAQKAKAGSDAKLREKDAKIADLGKNAADAQQKLSAAEAKIAELLEQAKQAAAKFAELETNAGKRDADYKQQIEQLNQALEKLKKDSVASSLKKEEVQARLQSDLEQSKADYQKRLDALAAEKEQELQKNQTTYQNLVQSLKQEVDEKSVTIEQYKEKLTIKMIDRILFGSGSARINESGVKVLKKIGNILKAGLDGRQIRVEGHTDNMPIGGEKIKRIYPTNWELSTARAVHVVRYLQENAAIAPEKMNAVGFGEFHPIADNKTPEGQAQNRRIEIVLTPVLTPAQ
ncbi:MAG: OmpA family protein [Sulfuricellaceae bacterium]